MKYWSMAFMGMGVTLVAAIVIKFDMLGTVAGVSSLLLGYVLQVMDDRKNKG